MNMPKIETVHSKEQRKLVRDFRKACGISAQFLADGAGISQALLSQFECGRTRLSLEKFSSLIETMWRIADGSGNPRWSDKKRLRGLRKARQIAAKLAKSVAQTTKSPTLQDQVSEFAAMTQEQRRENSEEMWALLQRVEMGRLEERSQKRAWREMLDRANDYEELFAAQSEAIGQQAEVDELQERIEQRGRETNDK
jgi:transcriptional regulator with XRE-family HTH domain